MDQRPPHAPAVPAPSSPEIEEQVRAAQAQMTFERSRHSNLLSVPVAFLIAWVLWSAAPRPWVVAWVVLKLAVTAWRHRLALRLDRDAPERVHHWGNRLEVALFADGVVYGLLGTLLLPAQDPVLSSVMIATVIAIGSVGAVVLSMNFRAALAFTLPVLLPAAAWRMVEGGTVATYAGLGMSILLLLVVNESRRASEHTRSMLRVRYTMDQLAREREQALALAERSNAAKAHFIATISHEVRTPLHGILGLTRLLQAEAVEEAEASAAGVRSRVGARRRRAQRLRTIEKSGEHLLAIINDVLDQNRIEGGRLRLYEEPFDIVALVGEVVELQRVPAEEKGLTMSWLADMPAPRWVLGDSARVRQVLLNLLSNAVKFTDRGGVHLRLEQAADGLAHIEVSDSGPGVPPGERERIFEPFEQLDGSFARRHGGTGLGLAISRQLARAMQGNIECAAAPAGGALFRLTLMLPPCQAPLVAAGAAGPEKAHFHGHVLLVEDNPVNAIVAEHSLQQLGLTVTTVGDGHAAVGACMQRRYTLVLMDCQLPGLDGLEATRRIRAAEAQAPPQTPPQPPMPIVALTANALAGDRERCLAAGMNDHLAKPFTLDDLREVLQRQLGPPAAAAAAAAAAD